MLNSLSDIAQITIESGKGVLAALVREARKNGVSFTRRELAQLGNQICTRLDQDKLKRECIVQPDQVIVVSSAKPIPPRDQSESGVVAGIGGVTKIIGQDGVRYVYTDTYGVIRDFPRL